MAKKTPNTGSSYSNIRNNTILNVTTTTTTITRFTLNQLGFSKQQMKHINEQNGLKGYPMSLGFSRVYKHYIEREWDNVIISFFRGAINYGCVACIQFYADLQLGSGNMFHYIHLAVPFYLEASLRGHTWSTMHW